MMQVLISICPPSARNTRQLSAQLQTDDGQNVGVPYVDTLPLATASRRNSFVAATLSHFQALQLDHGITTTTLEQAIHDRLQVVEALEAQAAAILAAPSSMPLTLVAEALEDLPEWVPGGLTVPPGYRLGDEGVTDLDGNSVVTVPLLITSVEAPHHVPAEGSESQRAAGVAHVELAWRGPDGWDRQSFPRVAVATRREMHRLISRGLPISDLNTAAVVRYLASFETANAEDLPTRSDVGCGGWLDESSFCLLNETLRAGSTEGRQVVFRGDGGEDLAAAHSCHGTYDDWCELVEDLRDYPIVLAAMSAALASPLLEPIGAPGFLFDLAGEAGSGKTCTLQVCASMFGRPAVDDSPTAIQGWIDTRVSLATTASYLRHLPLCVDESAGDRDSRKMSEIVYTIANGRDKGRGKPGGLASAATWKLVLLSTGESQLTADIRTQGAHARTLPVWGSPFGGKSMEAGRLVESLKDGLIENYGHAGRRYIQYLVDHRAADGQAWRARYHELRNEELQTAGSNSTKRRTAHYFASMRLAFELAQAAEALPWDDPIDPVAGIRDAVLEERDASDQYDEALARIGSIIGSNRRSFEGGGVSDIYNRLPRWGKWCVKLTAEKPAANAVAIHCDKAHELLQAGGWDPTATLRAWHDRGYLAADSGRSGTRKTVSIDGIKVKAIAIRYSALASVGVGFVSQPDSLCRQRSVEHDLTEPDYDDDDVPTQPAAPTPKTSYDADGDPIIEPPDDNDEVVIEPPDDDDDIVIKPPVDDIEIPWPDDDD